MPHCIFPNPSGGVEALVRLLDSKVEHVLVNTVNALRVLVEANMENQTKVANSDAVSVLIDLLGKCVYFVEVLEQFDNI